jgi:Sulfotransferase domain
MSSSGTAATRAHLTQGRVPDFFIVGHAKSGTSALYRMLSSHPRLYMPRKEPSFFVPEFQAAAKRFPNGISEYMALFAGAAPGQLVGESTTWYLWSESAAARIAEARPDARIIAILREPASYLYSLHGQFLRTDIENEVDFRRALALEPERREGRHMPRSSTRPKLLFYSEHVRYVDQLRRYEDAFGPEQVLVLIYDDFRADNEGTIRRIERFLGVEESGPVEAVTVNPAQGVRSSRLNWIVRSVYMGDSGPGRAVGSAIKAVTPQRARHRALGAFRRVQSTEPVPPDTDFMNSVRDRFRGEVVSLSEYLNRDLVKLWKY